MEQSTQPGSVSQPHVPDSAVVPELDLGSQDEADLDLVSRLLSKPTDTVELTSVKRAAREIMTTARILSDARGAALEDRDVMERALAAVSRQPRRLS